MAAAVAVVVAAAAAGRPDLQVCLGHAAFVESLGPGGLAERPPGWGDWGGLGAEGPFSLPWAQGGQQNSSCYQAGTTQPAGPSARAHPCPRHAQ